MQAGFLKSTHNTMSTNKTGSDDYIRVNLPNKEVNNVESDSELNGMMESGPQTQQHNSSPNAWNFEFYRQYFDVDTSQVLRRLRFSLLPNPRTNFCQNILKPNADLYGPFWIATTLILAAAIGGNVSNYLQSRGTITSWHYDFKKVTLASIIIYTYWWLMPLGLVTFFYFRSKRSNAAASGEDQNPLLEENGGGMTMDGVSTRSFVQLLSVYGYSLTVFVPVSILWTIPSTVLQWLLVALAILVSGTFLVFSLFPAVSRQQKKFAGPLVICIIVLHCLFSVGLMFTFFYGSSTPAVHTPVGPAPNLQLPNPAKLNPVKRSLPDHIAFSNNLSAFDGPRLHAR